MTEPDDPAAAESTPDRAYHMPWPDSDAPAHEALERRGGQVVIAGMPSVGGVAFGSAPRPYDLPKVPETDE